MIGMSYRVWLCRNESGTGQLDDTDLQEMIYLANATCIALMILSAAAFSNKSKTHRWHCYKSRSERKKIDDTLLQEGVTLADVEAESPKKRL